MNAPPDRRVERMDAPTCPHCQTPMTAVSRSDYVVYFRCAECGQVTSVRKAEWRPDGD